MYLLEIPEDYPEGLIGEYVKESSPDRFLFRRAMPLVPEIGVANFIFSARLSEIQKFDVLPNSTMVPLISPRAANILTEICADDFELISARVYAKDGELRGYSLVNIIAKVSAMNKSECQFTYIPGTKKVMKVSRLRCSPGGMGSHHLAREVDYMGYIWASPELKRRFEMAKIEGCEFVSPESVHA